MASNRKRKQMKRTTAQCVNHCQLVAEKMLGLRETFKIQHPEYLPLFDVIINNCFVQIGFIKAFGTRAWGYFPDELNKWLK